MPNVTGNSCNATNDRSSPISEGVLWLTMETERNINADQDQQAVKAVREGDAERYRELVQRHERQVFADIGGCLVVNYGNGKKYQRRSGPTGGQSCAGG